MTPETGRPPPSDKAFHYKSYRLFWLASAAAPFAANIISVSVGWQIYDITRNPLFLGYVGLAQFLPAFLLVLVTGLAADTFSRRAIMAVCLGIEMVCAGILLLTAFGHIMEIWPIYVALVMIGTARAFISPAASSLAPNLVPPEALSNALSLNATAWQAANIIGPAIGGVLYGIAPGAAYSAAALLIGIAIVLVLFIPKPRQARRSQAKSLDTLLAGFRYIWRQKIVPRCHVARHVRRAARRRRGALACLCPRHPCRRAVGVRAVACGARDRWHRHGAVPPAVSGARPCGRNPF